MPERNDKVIHFSKLRARMKTPPTETAIHRIISSGAGNGSCPASKFARFRAMEGGSLLERLRGKLKRKMCAFRKANNRKFEAAVKVHARAFNAGEYPPEGTDNINEISMKHHRTASLTLGLYFARCVEVLYAKVSESDDVRLMKDFDRLLDRFTKILGGTFYEIIFADVKKYYLDLKPSLSDLLGRTGLKMYDLDPVHIMRLRNKLRRKKSNDINVSYEPPDGMPDPNYDVSRLVHSEYCRMRGEKVRDV